MVVQQWLESREHHSLLFDVPHTHNTQILYCGDPQGVTVWNQRALCVCVSRSRCGVTLFILLFV